MQIGRCRLFYGEVGGCLWLWGDYGRYFALIGIKFSGGFFGGGGGGGGGGLCPAVLVFFMVAPHG